MENLTLSAHAYSNEQAEHLSRILRGNRSKTLEERFKQIVEKTDERRGGYEISPRDGVSASLYRREEFYRPADVYRSAPSARSPYGVDSANDYSRIVHSSYFRRLQGKTQLFPVGESELLRTRLTHSLEVAEIAARMVTHLNKQYVPRNASREETERFKIDISIVTAGALAHDIGHPPFGHSGELALNSMMRGNGGFEGNAQTLRILTRLENRLSRNFPPSLTPSAVSSDPLGLNLLYRTIAATIKYDNAVPDCSAEDQPIKGYYNDDARIVEETKRRVIKGDKIRPLKTLECQIMDLADDIAYSTYDLEDCMISGVATPLDVISANDDNLERIVEGVNRKLEKSGYLNTLTVDEIQIVFFWIFKSIITFAREEEYNLENLVDRSIYLTKSYRENVLLAKSPLFRRRMTEVLIHRAIEGCSIVWDGENPELSRLEIATAERLIIECLKAFNYENVIGSQRLRVHERKSRAIIEALFTELQNDSLGHLIDDDLREDFRRMKTENNERSRMRFICDYIASMTDSKAMNLYSKLRSDRFVSVFGLTI